MSDDLENGNVTETIVDTAIVDAGDGIGGEAYDVSLQTINDIPDDQLDAFIADPKNHKIVHPGAKNEELEAVEDALTAEQIAALEALSPEELAGLEELKGLSPEDLKAIQTLAGESVDAGEGTTDFKAFYEALTKPFKANGREITITDPEEAIALMQKGLGYNKDMQALAPHKRVINLLKQRNALDPERLNFLLDVSEGKPDALAKFLKDQKLNPMDINVDDGDKYKSTYEDNEPLNALNEVLDSLEPGEHKIKTLNIFSDGGWDEKSKNILYSAPNNIKILNKQIANGTFDIIMAEVDKQKALGNHLELSDLEAYNTVGNLLASNGKPDISRKPNNSTTTNVSNDKKALDDKRKKAAGSPRNAPSNVPNAQSLNVGLISDDEVEKLLAEHRNKELAARNG